LSATVYQSQENKNRRKTPGFAAKPNSTAQASLKMDKTILNLPNSRDMNASNLYN
jgi:hypothetical protein